MFTREVVAAARAASAAAATSLITLRLATGSRSAVFAWGRNAVAKVPFAATPEDWIHFEALYSAAVHDAGAPAPRFLGIERIDGRAASIYERVHGRSMWAHIDSPAGSCRKTG